MSDTIEHVKCLIIGSGPAGYTAAIYAARANMHPVLYQGTQPGGQLTTTNEVENFPGYPDGVTGPEMMIELQKQAERFETDVRNGWITKVDFSGDVHKVWVNDTKEIHCDTVIISTGASAKYLGLDSEQKYLKLGGGVSACAVCDGFFYRNQEVVIVGAGDSACEEAHYLSKLCTKVTMLVRRDEFRASKIMQARVENTENIEILYNTETDEVLGDGQVVTGVRVFNNQTKEKHEIPATGFFVAIGHKPNTDIFKDFLDLDETGYIINIPGTSKTNVEGVFVSGDAADHVYRQAVTAAGTGCMAALDAERYLAAQGEVPQDEPGVGSTYVDEVKA
jgi:thioredoxin reductase (NADPH)